MKFFSVVLALALVAAASTVPQQQQDTVSRVPIARLFPYYTGRTTLNALGAAGIQLNATDTNCGYDYYAAVQKINHEMFISGAQPASINVNAPPHGVGNCLDLKVCWRGQKLLITRTNGSILSLDHYEVFTSYNGYDLDKEIDLAPSADGMDLQYFAVSSDDQFYVKAVGKPLMRNLFVGPVSTEQCGIATHIN